VLICLVCCGSGGLMPVAVFVARRNEINFAIDALGVGIRR
jgi:hypothetical protein